MKDGKPTVGDALFIMGTALAAWLVVGSMVATMAYLLVVGLKLLGG